MTRKLTVKGHVAPGFEAVRAVFEQNFMLRGDIGAGVCARVEGQVVVDLWAGYADREQGLEWQEDTVTTMFSCTWLLWDS